MTTAAQAQATKEQAAIAAKLRGGKFVAVTAAIETASASGTPISARYEVEDGKLQLSVFVQKDGAYSEVFVNYTTGKVAKIDKITTGDDMKDAKSQSRAMAKAKTTLAAALAAALAANPGYTAIDIIPALEGTKPVAEITVMKDGQFKGVSQPMG